MPAPSLPRQARLPINRCSLPAVILGSLTYQRHPVPLLLDGVAELHQGLFNLLAQAPDAPARAQMFTQHMRAVFSLMHPEEAGYSPHAPHARARANYLSMMRGWAFDADGMEGAVLKGWVESRFGLLPRHHGGPIRNAGDERYRAYLESRARGLYGANALEAQLDLLYAYAQHELALRLPGQTHLTLYRGINRVEAHESTLTTQSGAQVLLFNSLSSFSASRERADEFGDTIMAVQVPLPKVFFFHGLLPGTLRGEEEYAVIGGMYEVDTPSP